VSRSEQGTPPWFSFKKYDHDTIISGVENYNSGTSSKLKLVAVKSIIAVKNLIVLQTS
jgi:hypothetical protein